jgi:hypothetical protein
VDSEHLATQALALRVIMRPIAVTASRVKTAEPMFTAKAIATTVSEPIHKFITAMWTAIVPAVHSATTVLATPRAPTPALAVAVALGQEQEPADVLAQAEFVAQAAVFRKAVTAVTATANIYTGNLPVH